MKDFHSLIVLPDESFTVSIPVFLLYPLTVVSTVHGTLDTDHEFPLIVIVLFRCYGIN